MAGPQPAAVTQIEREWKAENHHGNSTLQSDHCRAPRRHGQRLRRADARRRGRKDSARAEAQDRRPQQPGRITARHRGGGHKRMYRLIDFRRNKDGVPAMVDSIQYDPNRSARIALLHYVDGEKRYILAPQGLKAGDQVHERPRRAAVGRQLPAAAKHSAGHGDSQYRAAARPRRRAVPFGRRRRDAGRPRRRLGPDQPAQRRNPPRAGRLPGHDRRDRQRRTT